MKLHLDHRIGVTRASGQVVDIDRHRAIERATAIGNRHVEQLRAGLVLVVQGLLATLLQVGQADVVVGDGFGHQRGRLDQVARRLFALLGDQRDVALELFVDQPQLGLQLGVGTGGDDAVQAFGRVLGVVDRVGQGGQAAFFLPLGEQLLVA